MCRQEWAFFTLTRASLPAFCLTLIFLAADNTSGKEQVFPDQNFAITIPDDWQAITNFPPQPGVVAAFGEKDKTRVLWIMVDERKKAAGFIDDNVIAEFERGIQDSGGGIRVSGKYIEIDGIRGYERLGKATVNGNPASMMSQIVIAGGKFYGIQGMRFGAGMDDDAEIRTCLASFRFMTRPTDVVFLHSSKSTAYRIGYFIGSIVIIALALAVGVAVIRALMAAKRKPEP